MPSPLINLLPCLHTQKHGNTLTTIDAVDADLSDALYHLFWSKHAAGSTVVLDVPTFSNAHPDTGKTHTFDAQTFNLQVKSLKRELDDNYEGKTWYTHHAVVKDLDSGAVLEIDASFYQGLDSDLIGLAVRAKT